MKSALVVVALIVSIVWGVSALTAPMKNDHRGAEHLQHRQNDPQFREEMAQERREVDELARQAATQPVVAEEPLTTQERMFQRGGGSQQPPALAR